MTINSNKIGQNNPSRIHQLFTKVFGNFRVLSAGVAEADESFTNRVFGNFRVPSAGVAEAGRENFQKPGFTLLELVIAMGIFMIFMTVVLNTFITLTTTQQKANLAREAMSEAKEILNYISIEAKEKRLDYSCLESSKTNIISIECLTGDAKLVFISNDGLNRILINSIDSEPTTENENSFKSVTAETQSRENIFSAWQQPSTVPLHSPRLKIRDFIVEYFPDKDPYDLSIESPKQHPVAQIRLVVERNSKDPNAEAIPIVIQTSIASRSYSPQEI